MIELVPESQAYMDLLAFENKLDSTIMRKRLDIQESLKKPIKQKRTLRFYVSTNFYPAKNDDAPSEWELRVEGIDWCKFPTFLSTILLFSWNEIWLE